MIIVVDSDGLIGSINSNDFHHKNSLKIIDILRKKQAKLIYPATTIAESVTFLQGRLNKPQLADVVLNLVKENNLAIEPVDSNLLREASLIINLKGGKHNTLFDAIVAAVAQRHKADAIFSFDKFYKSKGFTLASEMTSSMKTRG